MTYRLYLGDRLHSSWSLRVWLLFERTGIPRRTTWVDFSLGPADTQLGDVPPARLVPCLVAPEGTVIWESLAIAEELASRHPEAGLWPEDPVARATARSLAAEMHAGFLALRNDCPMNLAQAFDGFQPSDAVRADLDRLVTLWAHARGVCGGEGPWLCGGWSIADAFFAPVAARIAGYGLEMPAFAAEYVAAHLADPAFRRWRAMGLAGGEVLARYAQPFEVVPWPGPVPRPARAVERGLPINDACPFSGDPITDLADIDGRILGFCNPFCRDKAVADADAWPQVVALLAR